MCQAARCADDLNSSRLWQSGGDGGGESAAGPSHLGCTSVTELSGSCLMVVDSDFWNPAWFEYFEDIYPVRRGLKELQVVEANDCGLLRLVQERDGGRVMWQRVHKKAAIYHRYMASQSASGSWPECPLWSALR